MNNRYLLDTSAVLTVQGDEEGSDKVEFILRQAESGEAIVYASFMIYMEVYYRIYRKFGIESATNVYTKLRSLPIYKLDPNENILIQAGTVKAKYSLSVADAWIIASAIEVKASLVHKDPEFEQLKDIVPMVFLPYKH